MGHQQLPWSKAGPWTKERVEILERMWREGHSASVIARHLGEGITRNAVLGKAMRMDLPRRDQPSSLKKDRAIRRVARRAKQLIFGTMLGPTPIQPPTEIPDNDNEVPPEARVKFADLEDHHCRWPIGDPRLEPQTFGFCGQSRRPGASYCPGHMKRAYVSIAELRRRERAEAKKELADA